MSAYYELFHVLTQTESARIRLLVSELELHEAVRLRNLHYPEVAADFNARGGNETPALWDGEALLQGETAVSERLRALAANRPA